MKLALAIPLLAAAVMAGPPSITELQPRGVQKGRSFTLTIAGLSQLFKFAPNR